MLSFHFVLLFLDNALHIIHARAEQRKQQCLLAALIRALDLKLLGKHMRMDIIIRATAGSPASRARLQFVEPPFPSFGSSHPRYSAAAMAPSTIGAWAS